MGEMFTNEATNKGLINLQSTQTANAAQNKKKQTAQLKMDEIPK